ncbi:hypothetical protein F4813DRAFT_336747 [Daldinia decipiens]|uniref:uncharacterized protein n=1 Tax=Daldinia decipiens TaxID=326647 RepID=UPI0020C36AE9|nr:uncharacterized protein F4813DRAFT_336747 [Daldinia decipiens]KAI1659556.1 hypothetical protein F4813DRAFT_336747 [Daldinia decipiens]
MADTVYRRSGRGGAGNFYSQKDIEEATGRKSEDLEAQKSLPLADDEPLTDPADGPAQHVAAPIVGSTTCGVRTGRGGAGNFVDVPLLSSSSSIATTAPTTTASTAHASNPQDQPHPQSPPTSPRRGGALSGRGGAGNWTSEHGESEPYDQEQERKRREALDAHILQDIRDSLPQPPKIHYMHGPGRGRKPDLPA